MLTRLTKISNESDLIMWKSKTFGENFSVRKHRKERILNGKGQEENWHAIGTALGMICAGWAER
jgi:hypothetical protein